MSVAEVSKGVSVGMAGGCGNFQNFQKYKNKYRICTELAQVFEISAAELLNTCCRDSADSLLPCCRGAAELPIVATYQIGSL